MSFVTERERMFSIVLSKNSRYKILKIRIEMWIVILIPINLFGHCEFKAELKAKIISL